MPLAVSITVDDVLSKLRAFLLGIVPTGTIVLVGPLNRTAQPATDHVIITPTTRKRLRTNVDTDVDTPGDGHTQMEQGTKLGVQVDFYGTLAGDWCAMFTTAFRDEYGVTALAPTCAPLYADDGRMMPSVTGEEQFLDRWMVDAMLQYNPVTTIPQQFFDSAEVGLINVDVEYPPT